MSKSFVLNFDGVDDAVNCGVDAALKIIGDQTLEFWYFRSSGTLARRNPIAKAYAGEGTITEEITATGPWFNYFYGILGYDGGSINTQYQQFPTIVTRQESSDNVWYHIAIRFLAGIPLTFTTPPRTCLCSGVQLS